jgi:dihydrofolate reductase
MAQESDMKRIIVTEFLTLDGIMEAPEQWVPPYFTEEMHRFKLGEMEDVDLLLGGITYQIFADSWPSRKGPLAEKMNSAKKHVVSSHPENLTWSNSHHLRGDRDVAGAIAALKQQSHRDLLVAGSGALVQTLIAHDLVDEYRLMIIPIVLGQGRRLFTDEGGATSLRLGHVTQYASGAVLLAYDRASAGATTGV